MYYMGIDPGKHGSVAIINKHILVFPTPITGKEYDIEEMKNILLQYAPDVECFCILERAQAMPGQGVVSMFEFGKGYGLWLALLTSMRFKFQVVHSRTWTKKMLEGAPGKGKERAFYVAKRLFPSWQPKFKKEYQFADSLLLAEYGRRLVK